MAFAGNNWKKTLSPQAVKDRTGASELCMTIGMRDAWNP